MGLRGGCSCSFSSQAPVFILCYGTETAGSQPGLTLPGSNLTALSEHPSCVSFW